MVAEATAPRRENVPRHSGFFLQGESENLPIVSKHGNCLILIKSSNGISEAGFVKMHKKEQKCAK
ncbi:MAG: hypothetical protein ACLSCO_04200 [Gallintestinimicrobium sp.]